MEPFFSKFPTIEYNNYTCTDISRRIKLSEQTKNALTLYYTYEVKNGTRADTISEAYYEDPTLDWLLYLTNNVVDPYCQWNQSEPDFQKFLDKKYGSYVNAIKRIAFYRNNWYDDDEELTPSYYENNLPNSLKKYYSSVYAEGTRIISWKRREEDWVVSTNKLIKLSCSNTNIEVGELVDVLNTLQTRVGGGEVTSVTDQYVIIKSIDGSFSNTNVIVGETSGAQSTITNTNTVFESITNDEGIFWSPVTYFDIENEANERRKQILILDNSLVYDTMDKIQEKLRE